MPCIEVASDHGISCGPLNNLLDCLKARQPDCAGASTRDDWQMPFLENRVCAVILSISVNKWYLGLFAAM